MLYSIEYYKMLEEKLDYIILFYGSVVVNMNLINCKSLKRLFIYSIKVGWKKRQNICVYIYI